MAQPYTLESIQFEGGDGRIPTAKVVVCKEGEEQKLSGISTGQHTADAAFRAVNRAIGLSPDSVSNIRFAIQTKTCDSKRFWDIEVSADFAEKGVYGGRKSISLDASVDPFVLVAHAYIQALNSMFTTDGEKPVIYPTPSEKEWHERFS